MKASGNSNQYICALNILKLVRGDVPYARTKGIDPRLRGGSSDAQAELTLSDARTIVSAFEPRVEYGDVEISGDAENGNLTFIINMSGNEDATNE